MVVEVSVKITGLKELSGAFRAVDDNLPVELKAKFLGVAQHIVGIAQQRMPHITGRAQNSVKARASARGAAIAFGGSAAPYMPWLDFGGSVGRGHKPGVAWSGAIKRDWQGVPLGEGRYVYPAISEARPETEKAVDEAIQIVAREAGFETKGGL